MDAVGQKSVALGTVLVITNIPTPYRIPLFNELAAQLKPQGGRLKVAFGATGYRNRKWQINLADCQFDYEILPSRTFFLGRTESASFSYPGLWQLLARERPAAIIVTGFSLATVKLWWRSLFRATPYLIWSGSIATGGEANSFLRRLQRRLLIGRAAAFVAYGSAARDYLVSLGAPAARISVAINTVDTDFFTAETVRLRLAAQAATARMGGPRRFLYIGELSKRKNVQQVLTAAAALAMVRKDFAVDIVGDGEERASLEAWAAGHGLGGVVTFHGYRQKQELPAFLAQSTALLFQTDFDIWGLVLTEGMAAGLVPLASVKAGATADLVNEGVTGFAVDYANVAAVTGRMAWILDHPEQAATVAEAASRFICDHASLSVSAAGMLAAINTATGRP